MCAKATLYSLQMFPDVGYCEGTLFGEMRNAFTKKTFKKWWLDFVEVHETGSYKGTNLGWMNYRSDLYTYRSMGEPISKAEFYAMIMIHFYDYYSRECDLSFEVMRYFRPFNVRGDWIDFDDGSKINFLALTEFHDPTMMDIYTYVE